MGTRVKPIPPICAFDFKSSLIHLKEEIDQQIEAYKKIGAFPGLPLAPFMSQFVHHELILNAQNEKEKMVGQKLIDYFSHDQGTRMYARAEKLATENELIQ